MGVRRLKYETRVLCAENLKCYHFFFFLSCLDFCWPIRLMRSIFRSEDRITGDTLCGAASVYLLLGLIWTMVFSILEKTAPGSFRFAGQVGSAEQFDRFLGFSYTTLTTLGYGNVAPATPQADALATIEAIVGQFYLAVVIARFVALQIVQGSNSSQTRE